MKIKELLEKLKEFDGDMDISIEVIKKGVTWRVLEMYDVGLGPDEDDVRIYADYWGR